jgi:hypothetical protein
MNQNISHLHVKAVGLMSVYLLSAGIAFCEINEGLVAYYPLHSSESGANDASGNGNQGTVHGAVFQEDALGVALHFDGTSSSYVEIPRSPSLEPQNAITIALWCKGIRGPGQTYGTMIRKADNCEPGYIIRTENHNPSDTVQRILISGGCSGTDASASFLPGDDLNWMHFVATYSRDDGLVKTYVNGQFCQAQSSGPLQHSGQLYIGGSPVHGEDGGFNGFICEVRIYARALSSDDVQQLFAVPPFRAPGVEVMQAPVSPVPPILAENVDFDYFHDQLAAYGTWVDVQDYGPCWSPSASSEADWRPYSDHGHWIYTENGWYWESDYPWGEIAFHYGRWFLAPSGVWVWLPDYTWGPSWVCWRKTADCCGWAPLPPGAHIEVGVGLVFNGKRVNLDFGLNERDFTFVAYNHFLDSDVHGHVLSRSDTVNAYNSSKIVNNYKIENNIIVNEGLGRDQIQPLTQRPIKTEKVVVHDPRIAKQISQPAGPTGSVRPQGPTPTETGPRGPRRSGEPPGVAPGTTRGEPGPKTGSGPVPPERATPAGRDNRGPIPELKPTPPPRPTPPETHPAPPAEKTSSTSTNSGSGKRP